MEFDATTFALEIVNFLVLVWLLQRLFYRPVAAAVARRQAGVEKVLADAADVRAAADALKGQFENRMANWEAEKAAARRGLDEEMDAERARRLAALNERLDEERERQRVIAERHTLDERRRLEGEIHAEDGRFVARLLERIAAADLEERIRRLLLEDLPRLPEEELQALRAAGRSAGKASVISAYPLDDAQRAGIAAALERMAGRPLACTFAQQADLIAGLRIGIGPWMLRASLADELKFFIEARRNGFR